MGTVPLGGSRIRLIVVAQAALVASLLAIAAAAAAGTHHQHRRHAARPATQLRGAMVTPNWSISNSPFALDPTAQHAEIQRVCDMGGDLIRLHVDWSQLQPGTHGQSPSSSPTFGPPTSLLPSPPAARSVTLPNPLAPPSVGQPPPSSDHGGQDPGSYDRGYLGRVDQVMAWAARCHIDVIADLVGTPCWATGADSCNGSGWIFDPPAGGTFEAVVAFLLARYPALYGLEVWNEPNGHFWNGTPRQYAALVNEAVAARDAVGSRTKIIAGALLGDGTSYLTQLYAAGMRGQDGISIHPYSIGCASSCDRFVDPLRRRSPFRTAIQDSHSVMAQNGDHGGLYLTEFGFATCPAQPSCVSDRRAARWLARSFQAAARYPYVRGLTVFSMRDFADRHDRNPGWDMRSGILQQDLSPKPAFRAVKRTLSRLRQPRRGHSPTGF